MFWHMFWHRAVVCRTKSILFPAFSLTTGGGGADTASHRHYRPLPANAMDQATATCLDFIRSLGIEIQACTLPDTTFLPGLELAPNCIRIDWQKLKYPGDLLHEAGHLAVTPKRQRFAIGTPESVQPWPDQGEEMGALLWSYAALRHLQLPPEFVFHPHGYKNDAAWLVEQFNQGNYIGMPILEWAGLALGRERAQAEGQPAFPQMLKWMRD